MCFFLNFLRSYLPAVILAGRAQKYLLTFSFLLFSSYFTLSFAQQLSSDTWIVRNIQYLQDLGFYWKLNTQFKPYQTNDILKYGNNKTESTDIWLFKDLKLFSNKLNNEISNGNSSLHGLFWPGIFVQIPNGNNKPFDKTATSLYLINQFWFKNHFSVEWYIRASSDPSSLEHFTPIPRTPKRLGMNSGEYDQATFSYFNSWLKVQFGRGRQIWGPALVDNLMLSANSAAYDHLMIQAKYKNFTGIFFTGFLESIPLGEKSINRYISGHGIQYSNQKNLLISFSEISIYYGTNRPLDLSYLNPFVPHIEVELDDRENDITGNHSNAVWVASLDWMLPKTIRISASYLIDEFQFDQTDRDKGRPDATALQFRLSKSFLLNNQAITIFSKYNRVGIYTFRHGNPYTAFLARDFPLGFPTGSDFYKIDAGLRWISHFRFIFELNYTFMKQGENNILENKYVSYSEFLKTNFPSGNVNTVSALNVNFLYLFRPNIELKVIYNYQNEKYLSQDSSGNYILFKLNYHTPFMFSL